MTEPPLFRLRLRLDTPLGTPLTSGTLFGHLCWAVRERDGEEGLCSWLDAQKESPWLVSDGLPADLLPRPLLRPVPPLAMTTTEEADAAKKRDRQAWVTVSGFLAVRDAMSNEALGPHLDDRLATDASRLTRVRLAHNTIDRQRGGTPDEGGLFFVDEDWSFAVAPLRDVYVRAAAPSEEIADLFRRVGEAGYGRDATWGRGRFTLDGPVTPVPELDAHDGPRRVSLSHGTLTANMTAPRYRLFTHYGKIGDAMAATGARVWKRPVLLARPGATFRPADEGPFGALLDGVHQDNPEIRHDARHVAIPYREVEAPE